MFSIAIEKIDLKSHSSQANIFFHKRFLPKIKQIKTKIQDIPLSIMFWIPDSKEIHARSIEEVQEKIGKFNINIIHEIPSDLNQMIFEVEKYSQIHDVIIAIIPNDFELLNELLSLSAPNLFIFTGNDRSNSRRIKKVIFPDYFIKGDFCQDIFHFINKIQTLKFIETLFISASNYSKSDFINLYDKFKNETDLFLNEGHLFLLAFIRYLQIKDQNQGPNRQRLMDHLYIRDTDINISINNYIKFDFASENQEQIIITKNGEAFFKLFNLSSLPCLEEEKKLFKERWIWPINTTHNATTKLFKDQDVLKELGDQFYFSEAKQFKFMRKIRAFWSKYVWDWMTKEQKKFWQDPLVNNKLFKIWRENIAGITKGLRTLSKERTDFFEYMFDLYEITHNPVHKEVYENFKNLVFGLRMLRPNRQGHIYMTFSFTMRPLKKFIRQYFRMAAITGEYELLLRRFPPYWHILILYAAPGARTSYDSRGFDMPAITFPLDLQLSVPLNLFQVQTRRNDRFIRCPVEKDLNLEAVHQAKINNLQGLRDSKFPHPGYFGSVDYTDDGEVIDSKGEKVVVYGVRRSIYVPTNDELTLVKANYCPGNSSGIVVKFNLIDPIAIMVGGIDGKKEITLDEINYLWKTLEIYRGGNINKIIDDVFDHPQPGGVKNATHNYLKKLEEIRLHGSEEKAWEELINRLIKGTDKNLIQTICHGLTTSGFEYVFSFWPNIMGKEFKGLEFDQNADITKIMSDLSEITFPKYDPEASKQNGDEQTKTEKKDKNEIPLLENLKRELEDLLKNIFARYLDISAATARQRSEPRLAGMIVEQCINLKRPLDHEFRNTLKDFLFEHYETHYAFMKMYYASMSMTSNEINIDIETLSAADADGIMNLIINCRERLVSRCTNNRLLRYIDPDSIVVQVGNFKYEGVKIVEENKFISENRSIQTNLGKKKITVKGSRKAAEIDTKVYDFKSHIEREKAKIKSEESIEKHHIHLHEKLKVEEGHLEEKLDQDKKEIEKIRSKVEVLKITLEQTFAQMQINAYETGMQGNYKNFAFLALLTNFQSGGIAAVEAILKNTPNIIMAIAPELHKEQEVDEMKEKIIGIMQNHPELMNTVNNAMFMDKEVDDIVKTDLFQNFAEQFANALEYKGFLFHKQPQGK